MVNVGDEFVITLDSNATTGYRFELAQPLDEHIVTLVNHEYQGSGLPIAGAGGQEHWTFKAIGAGATQIALIYKRANQPGTFSPTARCGSRWSGKATSAVGWRGC